MSEAHREWPIRTDYRAELRDPERQRRDSDAMLDRVSKSEVETAEVYRRIEDQLRNMARRLDASERNQTENSRVMSKAAVEMNIAAREQAQAFDQLGGHVTHISERLERLEGREGSDGMREAVKALHQGLSRLADQITETANQSAAQISNLADNLETVAGRASLARQEAQATAQALESRFTVIDERVKSLETGAHATAASIDRAFDAIEAQKRSASHPSDAIVKLEDSVRRLEERGDNGADRRLIGVERALNDVMARLEHHEEDPALGTLEDNLRKLMVRLDQLEEAQREAAEAARKASEKALEPTPGELPPQPPVPPPSFEAQQPFTPPPFAQGQPAAAFASLPGYEPPPFAEPAPPPFAAQPASTAPTAAGFGDPLTNYELPADTFEAAQGQAPTTVESYLAAARRSARAAAQQETERSAKISNSSWGGVKPTPVEKEKPRTHPAVVVGLVTMIAIVAIIGAVLHHQQATPPAQIVKAPLAAPAKVDAPAPDLHSTTQEPMPQPGSQTAAPGPQPQQTAPAPQPGKPLPAGLGANGKPGQQTAALPQQQAGQQPPRPGQPAINGKSAIDRLTQAANGGNAKAELIVGLKYLEGDGVPANEGEAVKWLAKAADKGEPVAQYRLGTLFERGRGMQADAAKAARWYQAAATQGNRKAMYNLAVAFTTGAGVNKDYAEASRWFLKAANLGLSDSQFNLAVLYERGLGVPQNLVDAYKWYAIAAAQGDGESKSRLAAISSQLDNEARAAAQHAADVFKPGGLDARANVAPTVNDVVRG